MGTLDNKIILVTGAAAGIGYATAKLASQQGAHVILADLDANTGQKSAGILGVPFHRVDIANETSVKMLYAEIEKKYNRLDALINAAGVLEGAYVTLDDLNIDTWHSVVNVNLTGCFLSAKYAVPLFRRAGRGVIVLVSSLAAELGSSSFAYGASKGGVNGLALTLERQLARENIRVNVVMPGNIDTGMKRNVIATEAAQRGESLESAIAASQLGNPEGVARVLAWLVSDEADYVRGKISTR
jgi:3-oxoacyl-[acyl-carrier protein] reductase